MRVQSFKTSWDYIHYIGTYDRTNHQDYPVPVSDLQALVAALKNAIADNDAQAIKTILKAEFVFATCLRSYQVNGYDSIQNGIGQRDDYRYADHNVAPVLEALVVHYPDEFNELYDLATNNHECKNALLDFSDLDLAGADITNIDFSAATFYGTDLTKTEGITYENLEQSISYDFAKTPAGIVQLWTEAKAQKVVADLVQLKEYARTLMLSTDEEGQSKGQLLLDHANELIDQVMSSPKHDQAFQTNFLEKLNQHNQEFDKPRYYGIKTILANIALFILGVGVLYAAAVGIHYATTKRSLFFSRTTSRELIDEVADDMEQENSEPQMVAL